MELIAAVGAPFGSPDAQPALDDVAARLAAIDGRSSHGVFFDPEVAVRPWAHLQGITRLPIPGTAPWVVISKHHQTDKRRAGMFFVRFPHSRSRGEALHRDKQPGGPGVGELVRFWARGLCQHPGGLQSCGHFIAVAQDPAEVEARAFVSLIDARVPEQPSFLPPLVLDGSHGETPSTGSSCAALTRLADGRYLLAVYQYSENNPGRARLWLFASTMAALNGNTQWRVVGELRAELGLPSPHWVERVENIALVNQRDGTLFLAALHGGGTDNHVHLFRLERDGRSLTWVSTKYVRTLAGRGTFRAGGSLYVAPSGELVLYAVQQAGGSRIRDMMIEEFSV